jgi:hypothetical protein
MMTDSTEDAVDLTGEWRGYYKQHGVSRPIVATLVQTGSHVTGTMRDVETEFEQSLFDAALEAGLPPGADEQIDRQLREMFPKAGRVPIRGKSRLPSESTLDGTADDDFVTFVKTYKGQHFTGYQIGDDEVGAVTEDHSVQYKGRIQQRGRRVEGFWSISRPNSPETAQQGPFVLERV